MSINNTNTNAHEPTILIIFGITGDLSRRKLLPALWHLFRTGKLPSSFQIIGFSRRDFSGNAIRIFVREALGETLASAPPDTVRNFLECFSYQQGHFDEPEQYRALAKHIESVERTQGAPANRIFYLSIAPIHYEEVFEALHNSGLASSDVGVPLAAHPPRILVEKPFGRDTETAHMLDAKLGALFREEQIYRIDHYLAKETVQNIISFRFSNFIFDSIWNKNGIERVHIELLETLGIEGRSAFYSDTGALRDVGQNHLLQLLAMIAMENPGQLDAASIRSKRAEVLTRLRPMEDILHSVVRGQYEGFAQETGAASSQTETYFKLRVFLDDPVWDGVPFLLESGKRMKKDITRVTIYFKNATRVPCAIDGENECQNALVFEIKPKEGITIFFFAKKPGFSQELERRTLHFSYQDGTVPERVPDAYERVLYDCIRGDQTLFTSTDEVQAAWHYITPILAAWKEVPLELYQPGSLGPGSRTNV